MNCEHILYVKVYKSVKENSINIVVCIHAVQIGVILAVSVVWNTARNAGCSLMTALYSMLTARHEYESLAIALD